MNIEWLNAAAAAGRSSEGPVELRHARLLTDRAACQVV